jgi:hypothetical protein
MAEAQLLTQALDGAVDWAVFNQAIVTGVRGDAAYFVDQVTRVCQDFVGAE